MEIRFILFALYGLYLFIDYIRLNGDPRKPKVLHYFSRNGRVDTTERILSFKNKWTSVKNKFLRAYRIGVAGIKRTLADIRRSLEGFR